eukprot:4492997-Amphidinium_carterae.1
MIITLGTTVGQVPQLSRVRSSRMIVAVACHLLVEAFMFAGMTCDEVDNVCLPPLVALLQHS